MVEVKIINYLLLAALYHVLLAKQILWGTENSQIGRVKPVILRGEPAIQGEVPFIVSFKVPSNKRDIITTWENLCGGCIIGQSHVLTAAHCFENDDFFYLKHPEILKVIAGHLATEITETADLFKSPDYLQWRKVGFMIIHPEYSFPQNDLAVVIVNKPWIYNEDVDFIPLSKGNDANFTNCIVAGYGRISHSKYGAKAPPVLLFGNVTLMSSERCSQLWGLKMDKFVCSENVFHTGYTTADVARGDSGGPVICQQLTNHSVVPEKDYLVGIICGKNFDLTTLFIRISAYNDFLTNALATKYNVSDVSKLKNIASKIECRVLLLTAVAFNIALAVSGV